MHAARGYKRRDVAERGSPLATHPETAHASPAAASHDPAGCAGVIPDCAACGRARQGMKHGLMADRQTRGSPRAIRQAFDAIASVVVLVLAQGQKGPPCCARLVVEAEHLDGAGEELRLGGDEVEQPGAEGEVQPVDNACAHACTWP